MLFDDTEKEKFTFTNRRINSEIVFTILSRRYRETLQVGQLNVIEYIEKEEETILFIEIKLIKFRISLKEKPENFIKI